jgi:hypothetical protein
MAAMTQAGAVDLADAAFPRHDALASNYQSDGDFDGSGIGLPSIKHQVR